MSSAETQKKARQELSQQQLHKVKLESWSTRRCFRRVTQVCRSVRTLCPSQPGRDYFQPPHCFQTAIADRRRDREDRCIVLVLDRSRFVWSSKGQVRGSHHSYRECSSRCRSNPMRSWRSSTPPPSIVEPGYRMQPPERYRSPGPRIHPNSHHRTRTK
jgi:hypothetical protein